MSYYVTWNDDASADVQRIYETSTDPEGVAHTVLRIGLELSENPCEAGESREPGVRILFKYPLVVWFHIQERFQDVLVFRVKPMRDR